MKGAMKSQQRRSEAEWRELWLRFKESGLSQAKFCEQQGLALATLQKWFKRVADPSLGAKFVELNCGSYEKASLAPTTVEVTFPSGITLRVRS